MVKNDRYQNLVQLNAKQIASGLIQTLMSARNATTLQAQDWRIDASQVHFHDNSTAQIVWNDVQAVLAYNEHTGANLPVPLLASEGYGTHGHTGPYDGGWVQLLMQHSHTGNFDGGFAFACYYPGFSAQQPWAV